MIERGWFPNEQGVARAAVGGRSGTIELMAMDVFMATGAGARSTAEDDLPRRSAEVRRAVAFGAGNRAVSAGERETGRFMVKGERLLPRLGGMAGLAGAGELTGELILVRIEVTAGARKRGEMVLRRSGRIASGGRLPDVRAGRGGVGAAQCESSLLMAGERKGGGLKACLGMARFTAFGA